MPKTVAVKLAEWSSASAPEDSANVTAPA
jgi:hypothetical protein